MSIFTFLREAGMRGRAAGSAASPPRAELASFHTRHERPCEPAELLTGKMIVGTHGRYEIRKRLGKGSTAVVYLARDTADGTAVAVKAARASEAFPDAAEYIKHEARVLEALKNGSIPRFIDLCTADGTCLVMEHLKGQELSALVDDSRTWCFPGTIPWQALGPLILDVCSALDEVHKARIVHRDVTCGNILVVSEPGERNSAKLIDFGLAASLGADGKLERIRSDFVTGTVQYMAPEQLTGTDCDHRVDIHAIGVALYHALCGGFPFDAATSEETARRRIMSEVDLSTLQTVGIHIPSGVDDIVMRATRRNPAERFQSIEEMRKAIESVL